MARHRWDARCPAPTGLVPPTRIDPTGVTGPTRGQAAGRRWVRVGHGWYVPADAPRHLPEQRVLEAAALLPSYGAVTGWAACRMARATFLDGVADDGRTTLPVQLAVGSKGRIRPRPGIVVVSHERLAPWEWHVRHGVRVTRPERATFDEMRRTGDLRHAVEVVDMMAAARATSPARVAAYARARWGTPGRGLVLDALRLASEHSRSPRETRLRLVALLDAGLPALLVNCPVYSRDGRFLGVVDLLDLVAGLAIEFDGAEHRHRARHTADVRKEDRLRRHGLEVVRVTGTDLADVASTVDRLLAARARARFEPIADRSWVACPPADTLDEHLPEQEWLVMDHEHGHPVDWPQAG